MAERTAREFHIGEPASHARALRKSGRDGSNLTA